MRARACVVATGPAARPIIAFARAGGASPSMAPKMGTRVRLNEALCANIVTRIKQVLDEPYDVQMSDVKRLSLIFVIMHRLIVPRDPEMISQLVEIFTGASTGIGYYRFMAESIENIMEDPDLTSNARKIVTLHGFILAFAAVVRVPLPTQRPDEITEDNYLVCVRQLAINMKTNLWQLMHARPLAFAEDIHRALETNYVFFTRTMHMMQDDAETDEGEPAAPPAGGEPDAEPVSHYDTMIQHLRAVCPE